MHSGNGGATLMRYDVKADVGGKIAQLGGRLIDSTAKKLADEFFQKFSAIVGGGGTPSEAAAGPMKTQGWFKRLLGWLHRNPWRRIASAQKGKRRYQQHVQPQAS